MAEPTVILERGGNGKATIEENTAAIKGFMALVQSLGSDFFTILHKLIDLAKTNPLWGAVLGILINDFLVTTGSHKEIFCLDCNFFVSIYDWLTGSHSTHKYETRKVPGLISGNANLMITGLILSAYGIAEAGAIISDITSITNLTGSKSDPASLVKPSVTTLFEAGSGAAKAAVEDRFQSKLI